MRIHKLIDSEGFNAAISVNVNEPGSVMAASSSQGPAAEREDVSEETGTELPDREGTYDELREEATKKVEQEQATEAEQDR